MVELVTKTRRGPAAFGSRVLVLHLCLFAIGVSVARSAVEHDEPNKRVTLSEAGHKLVLCLNYDGRCVLDEVRVGGRLVVAMAESSPLAGGGVYSAIKIAGQWFNTRAGIDTPKVLATSN